jgi:hypothetical protein
MGTVQVKYCRGKPFVSAPNLEKWHGPASEDQYREQNDDQRRGDQDSSGLQVKLEVERQRICDGTSETCLEIIKWQRHKPNSQIKNQNEWWNPAKILEKIYKKIVDFQMNNSR